MSSPTGTVGGAPGQAQLDRLFGDGIVNQTVLGQFHRMSNTGLDQLTDLTFLDADNNGVVDQVDLGQFRRRFNANVF